MSGEAKRVLNSLMKYDVDNGFEFPIQSIVAFFDEGNIVSNL